MIHVRQRINYSINTNAAPISPIAMPAPRPANDGIAPLASFPDTVEEAPTAELLAVDDVPFCALAAAWNAAKLLGPLSTAFALNTIPEPQ